MNDLVADTHSSIWYYAGEPDLLKAAREAIDRAISTGGTIYLPSICLVEVISPVEKGRISAVIHDLMAEALASPAFGLVVAPLDQAVAETLRLIPRDLVPDMPDRIIAATALHLALPLVTADRKIHGSSAVSMIW